MTLKTIGERTTSDDFTLLVVTFGSSREQELTQSITVTLKPPGDEAETEAMTEGDITSPHPGMVKALAKAFDSAYLAARGATEGVDRSGEMPLETSSISVEVNFTIIGSASATPTIEVFGIDLTGSRTDTRENVHQITMTFTAKSS